MFSKIMTAALVSQAVLGANVRSSGSVKMGRIQHSFSHHSSSSSSSSSSSGFSHSSSSSHSWGGHSAVKRVFSRRHVARRTGHSKIRISHRTIRRIMRPTHVVRRRRIVHRKIRISHRTIRRIMHPKRVVTRRYRRHTVYRKNRRSIVHRRIRINHRTIRRILHHHVTRTRRVYRTVTRSSRASASRKAAMRIRVQQMTLNILRRNKKLDLKKAAQAKALHKTKLAHAYKVKAQLQAAAVARRQKSFKIAAAHRITHARALAKARAEKIRIAKVRAANKAHLAKAQKSRIAKVRAANKAHQRQIAHASHMKAVRIAKAKELVAKKHAAHLKLIAHQRKLAAIRAQKLTHTKGMAALLKAKRIREAKAAARSAHLARVRAHKARMLTIQRINALKELKIRLVHAKAAKARAQIRLAHARHTNVLRAANTKALAAKKALKHSRKLVAKTKASTAKKVVTVIHKALMAKKIAIAHAQKEKSLIATKQALRIANAKKMMIKAKKAQLKVKNEKRAAIQAKENAKAGQQKAIKKAHQIKQKMIGEAKAKKAMILHRAELIKKKALAKVQAIRVAHHKQKLTIQHQKATQNRAYNARRRAAVRRCSSHSHSHKTKHVTVYVKRNYWVKEKVANAKPMKAENPLKLYVKPTGCQPGPNGKPCAPKTAKKFVGPQMIHHGPYLKAKKVVKAKVTPKPAVVEPLVKKVVKAVQVLHPTCVVTKSMTNVERLRCEVKQALSKEHNHFGLKASAKDIADSKAANKGKVNPKGSAKPTQAKMQEQTKKQVSKDNKAATLVKLANQKRKIKASMIKNAQAEHGADKTKALKDVKTFLKSENDSKTATKA